MKTRIDARLLEESARFSFRFACDDCAHVDVPSRPGGFGVAEAVSSPMARCSLGYPAAPRRAALHGAAMRDALLDNHLELCKEFELA